MSCQQNGGTAHNIANVPELSSAIQSAKQDNASKAAFSEYDRLDAERSDEYVRNKKAKDLQAKIERETAEWLATLKKLLVLSGAYFAAGCFVLSTIALVITWFFPSIFPETAVNYLKTVTVFGFGMIATNILERLFPKN